MKIAKKKTENKIKLIETKKIIERDTQKKRAHFEGYLEIAIALTYRAIYYYH